MSPLGEDVTAHGPPTLKPVSNTKRSLRLHPCPLCEPEERRKNEKVVGHGAVKRGTFTPLYSFAILYLQTLRENSSGKLKGKDCKKGRKVSGRGEATLGRLVEYCSI